MSDCLPRQDWIPNLAFLFFWKQDLSLLSLNWKVACLQLDLDQGLGCQKGRLVGFGFKAQAPNKSNILHWSSLPDIAWGPDYVVSRKWWCMIFLLLRSFANTAFHFEWVGLTDGVWEQLLSIYTCLPQGIINALMALLIDTSSFEINYSLSVSLCVQLNFKLINLLCL